MRDSTSSASRSLLCIGVDEYASMPSLEFCVSDATAIAQTLSMPEFGFDDQLLLLNDQAQKQAAEQTITHFLRGSANFKLLYFSGHGAATIDDGFLVTPDGDEINPGVSLRWLRNQVVGATGIVIVVLDCCRAGLASVRDGVFSVLRVVDIDRVVPNPRSIKIPTGRDCIRRNCRRIERARAGSIHFPCIGGTAWRSCKPRGHNHSLRTLRLRCQQI